MMVTVRRRITRSAVLHACVPVLALALGGAPAAAAPAPRAAAASPRIVGTAGDWTGDGRADVIWYQRQLQPNRPAGELSLFSPTGDAAGVASSRLTSGVGMPDWAGVGDVNGDGRADLLWYQRDLVTGGLAGTLSAFIATPVGPVLERLGSGLEQPDWASVGDVNGDGRADVLWYQRQPASFGLTGTLSALVTSPAATSVSVVGLGSGIAPPDWAGAGDVNGDGLADAIWFQRGPDKQTGTISAFLTQPNLAGSVSEVLRTGIDRPQWAGVGDVTGDGKADLLWFERGAIPVLEPGSLLLLATNATGTAMGMRGMGLDLETPEWAGVGDVDGDGKADAIWYGISKAFQGQPRTVSYFRTNATATAMTAKVVASGVAPPDWAGSGSFSFTNGAGWQSLPVISASPTVYGQPYPGKRLTCTIGTWRNNPRSFTYEWVRDGVAVTVPLPSPTRTLTKADNGHRLACYVHATNPSGTGTARAFPVPVATPPRGAPRNVTLPRISGPAVAGALLTCTGDVWTNTPARASRLWLHGSTAIAAGRTYRVRPSDVGQEIECRVRLTNAAGSGAVTSPPRRVAFATGCLVPRSRGRTVAAVRRALTRAHCVAATAVVRAHSGSVRRGRVVRTQPSENTYSKAGTRVRLVVSTGRP